MGEITAYYCDICEAEGNFKLYAEYEIIGNLHLCNNCDNISCNIHYDAEERLCTECLDEIKM